MVVKRLLQEDFTAQTQVFWLERSQSKWDGRTLFYKSVLTILLSHQQPSSL